MAKNPPTERDARVQFAHLLAEGDPHARAVAHDLAETMGWDDDLLKMDLEDWVAAKGFAATTTVYTNAELRRSDAAIGGGIVTMTTTDPVLGRVGVSGYTDELGYDRMADDQRALDEAGELGGHHARNKLEIEIAKIKSLTRNFNKNLAARGLYFERRAMPDRAGRMTWTFNLFRKRATSASRIDAALSGLGDPRGAAHSWGLEGPPVAKRKNPGVDQAARDAYESFHRYPPKKTGEFEPGFAIPSHVFKQGKSIDVLYRSSKVDPETLKKPRKPIDYIHEHDGGVFTYLTEGEGERVEMPKWIREITSLVLLGKCLGFKFEGPDGKVVDAQGRAPLPELYTTVSGKCLVVVDEKRHPIAFVWGGRLDVEPRGIVH